MTADLRHPAEEYLLAFTRALRVAGLPVAADRRHGFLDAVRLVGLGERDAVRAAGRATLCGGPDDLLRFEEVFAAWFDEGGLPRPDSGPRAPSAATYADLAESAEDDGTGAAKESVRAMASRDEVLGQRDVATMTEAERRRLATLFAGLRPRTPVRRSARQVAWRRGQVDAGRTLRASLRRLGEPAEVVRRRRAVRPRRVVFLVDVSGSMSGYADAVLRMAHRYVATPDPRSRRRPPAEVFTVGTRLTRLTRAMQHRDPDRALVAAAETVPDWAGGTRLGETLAAFVDRWGARGMARGAVVVVVSDGWERGDVSMLASTMARLHALAHRVVWVNPHRGKEGYLPLQQGVVAALPFVDDFVAGHTLATYAEVLEVIGRA